MDKLSGTVGIVRSFNDPAIGMFVGSLLEYLSTVIVVVYAEADRGLTQSILESECGKSSSRISVVETSVKDGARSWSALLNTGITFARGMNAGGRDFKYIFNVSNTARFREQDALEMLSCFENPTIGIVGTTFRGVTVANEQVKLGMSYNTFPRNTGMIIRMEVFESHPLLAGFDPHYDGRNGMEDYAFVKTSRLFGWGVELLDLEVPILVGRHWNQVEKEEFMVRGMRDVEDRMKTLGL